MPRTGRGGARQGQPGKSYANRTDLNAPKTLPVQTAPSQQYGQAAQQERQQRAIPLPNNTALPPMPGELTPLNAPSAMPNEPVTHGAASGPGAGNEVLMAGGGYSDVGAQLRALYMRFPNPDLRDLLEVFDRQQGNV